MILWDFSSSSGELEWYLCCTFCIFRHRFFTALIQNLMYYYSRFHFNAILCYYWLYIFCFFHFSLGLIYNFTRFFMYIITGTVMHLVHFSASKMPFDINPRCSMSTYIDIPCTLCYNWIQIFVTWGGIYCGIFRNNC